MGHDESGEILKRIEAIDNDLISIQRRAALDGHDLRHDFDKLFAERVALEARLNGDQPLDRNDSQ